MVATQDEQSSESPHGRGAEFTPGDSAEESTKQKEVLVATSVAPPKPQPVAEPARFGQKIKQLSGLSSASSAPAPPRPTLTADYDAIERQKWILNLRQDKVIKVSTMRDLCDAIAYRIARGNYSHGHFSTGDEDEVWDNLRDAQWYIQVLADTVCAGVAGTLKVPPQDCLGLQTWASPLTWLLESAALRVLGPRDVGILLGMDSAVNRVHAASKDYHLYGAPVLDSFVDACAHCMGILCRLWQELAELVDTKFRQRDAHTMTFTLGARRATKMWAVLRTVENLPSELTERGAGLLTDLLNDTLEVFVRAHAMVYEDDDDALARERATQLQREGMTFFFEAAKKLAATKLTALKADGVKTSLPDEWWTMAAKEGLVIYMRGAPVHYTLPEDLSERMLDYVDHVLPALSLLVTDAVEEEEKQKCLNSLPQKLISTAMDRASFRNFPDLKSEGLPPFMTPWMRDRRLAAMAKPRTIRSDIISAVKKLDPNLSFPNYDEAAKRRWDRLVNAVGPAAKAKWQEQFGDVPQTF